MMNLLPLLLVASPVFAEVPPELVTRLKPTVVNLEVSVQHGLNAEGTGIRMGSGFIVDAEKGIIATNRHIPGSSPSRIKVVFEDGRTAEARLLHFDAWHDFAFVRLEPGDWKGHLTAAALGDSWTLEEQQDVLLIGNNDAQEYSVKFGKTANLHLSKGTRHSAAIQTTFDRAGGSSGSPVFDEHGRVIGIHFAGTNTTSFELRVEYITEALARLEDGRRVRRGDIGVALGTVLISDAQKHFRLPEVIAQRIMAMRKDIKRTAIVEYVSPASPAFGKLQPGDIVLEAGGKLIGDDVYSFDKIVDSHTGEKVRLTLVRGGNTVRLKLPVEDAEAAKLGSFALFAGGVLHDITPELRLSYNIDAEGVFSARAKNPANGRPVKTLFVRGYRRRRRKSAGESAPCRWRWPESACFRRFPQPT